MKKGSKASLSVRRRMSAGQLARKDKLGGGFKRVSDADLWMAADAAVHLTQNPSLRNALERIADKLKAPYQVEAEKK
jgi:predicted nucleic acid-binding protein